MDHRVHKTHSHSLFPYFLLGFSSLSLIAVLISVVYLGRSMSLSSRAALIKKTETTNDFYQTYPLSVKNPVYKFTLSGNVSLSKKTSYLRIVLVDNNNNEYLVYEIYPLLTDRSTLTLNNVCEETCLLDGIIPSSLKVYGYGASYEISETKLFQKLKEVNSRLSESDINSERLNIQKTQAISKINKINQQIKAKKFKWTAGETSISNLTYSQKRKLFPNPDDPNDDKLPNLQGFEYYKGGVFELASENIQQTKQAVSQSNLPSSFDYRNFHGENWMTLVKDQGSCGSCWAFAAVGAVEANINLYYNQHINMNLSEQNILCCSNAGSCLGGSAGNALRYIKETGVYEEGCWEYNGMDKWECLDICRTHHNKPSLNVKINNISSVPLEERALKTSLIQNGVIVATIKSIKHVVVLTGWETDLADGKTIWIYKSSWGAEHGEGGYFRMKTDINEFNRIYKIIVPIMISDRGSTNYSINCVDKDNDGYCYWGISINKPSTCPATCRAEKDCNDLNSTIDSTSCILPSDESLPYCQETSDPYNVNASGICNSSGSVSFTLPRDNDCDQDACCSAFGRRDRVCILLSNKDAEDHCKEGDSNVRYLADVNHSNCPSSGDPSYIQDIPTTYTFHNSTSPVFRNGEVVKTCVKDYSCRASDGSLDGSYWRCSDAFICSEQISITPTLTNTPIPTLTPTPTFYPKSFHVIGNTKCRNGNTPISSGKTRLMYTVWPYGPLQLSEYPLYDGAFRINPTVNHTLDATLSHWFSNLYIGMEIDECANPPTCDIKKTLKSLTKPTGTIEGQAFQSRRNYVNFKKEDLPSGNINITFEAPEEWCQ